MNALLIPLALLLLLADPPAYEPTSHYTVRRVEGWNVLVNNRLLKEEKTLGTKALAQLRVKLYDVNRAVPAPALDEKVS